MASQTYALNRMTLPEQVAEKLGISKERTRQIERQALTKLQKNGASQGLEDFLG